MKKQVNKDDFALELEQNALDSLTHGIEHLIEGDRSTDLKYGILHVFHAVELFLKARLAKAHPLLLYQKPEESLEKARTVDFDALLGRLRNTNVHLSQESIKDLHYLRRVRNDIEHHQVTGQRQIIEEYIGRTLRFLDIFLEQELGVILQGHLGKETYHTMSRMYYSYKDRVEVAKKEMKEYLPSEADIYISKGTLSASTAVCIACGEEAIAIPDPTSTDEKVHCFFCEARFYVQFCDRCGAPMLEETPFEKDDLVCENCWDSIMAED